MRSYRRSSKEKRPPGLLVRLGDPPQLYILADDLVGQRRVEPLAELIRRALGVAAGRERPVPV